MKIIKKDWGQVLIDQAEDGSIQVSFENANLFCQYSLLDCGTDEKFESPIRIFRNKSTGEDQVQAPGGDRESRIDAAAWRGCLVKAFVSNEAIDSITARLAWMPLKGPIAEQEVTIFKDRPWVQIKYIEWLVNIVDIAHPGGTDQGRFRFYGAQSWKRDYTFWENVYFCKYAGDIGYMNVTEVEDPTPLLYKDHFIMGVYNPVNGRGYGRVMPAEPVDIIKLLFEGRNCGFEVFPDYNRPHKPFSTFLFQVTEGAEGVLSTGKQIVDEMRLNDQG